MKVGAYTVGTKKIVVTKDTTKKSLEPYFKKYPSFKKAVLGNDNDTEVSKSDDQSKSKRKQSKSNG